MSLSQSILLICSLITLQYICVAKHVRFPPDTIDFFPSIKGNLTKLSWAHAVNNASYLESVLKDDLIMMIEADIVLGTLKGDSSSVVQPIMGHPPATTSDISLKQFLERINEANANNHNNGSIKGVKLDFKSIDVFEQSVYIVDEQYKSVLYPFWINADIIQGPVNSESTPVDAARFLNGTLQYSHAILSIGWTTRYGGLIKNGSYTEDQISDMVSVLSNSNSKSTVTFPVRAGIAANSQTQMIDLLEKTSDKKSTLTIWSSEGDFVDIDKLRSLIYACGIDKIYLDVPSSVSSQLHL